MEEHLATWVNFLVNLEPIQLRPYFTVNVLSAWIVICLILLMVRAGTRRMDLRATNGWQVVWEWAFESFENFCKSTMGPGGERFAPFLGTIFIYVAGLNLFGVIPGFISPTASLTMTFALSIPTILYVQYLGFRTQGLHYLMYFVGEPWWLFPLNIPIHVIGEFARVLSLAIRLFGNIFGEDTVIAQLVVLASGIFAATHLPIPIQFPMVLFHIFVSFVQALVFMMLAASYISGALPEEHGSAHGHEAETQSADA